MLLRLCLAVWLLLAAMASAASADDWVAVKLRGQVLQLVDNEWHPLARGNVVSDDRVVRTLKGGHVQFRRGREIIDLGPNTQIQIHDRNGQRFTTVTQYFGEVAIEAEARELQHFAVATPFLAAVVKGTRFVVRSEKNHSVVQVLSGQVAVRSEGTGARTVLSSGQSAIAAEGAELTVKGKGTLPPVVGADGKLLSVGGQPVNSAANPAALAAQLRAAAQNATGEERKALERAAREAEKQAKAAEKADKHDKKADKDDKEEKPGGQPDKPAPTNDKDKTEGARDPKSPEKGGKDDKKK